VVQALISIGKPSTYAILDVLDKRWGKLPHGYDKAMFTVLVSVEGLEVAKYLLSRRAASEPKFVDILKSAESQFGKEGTDHPMRNGP
jgi:hypothetical protein